VICRRTQKNIKEPLFRLLSLTLLVFAAAAGRYMGTGRKLLWQLCGRAPAHEKSAGKAPSSANSLIIQLK
jgi:hypothetical protein